MKSRPWTREETIIAFNVYCKIPFNASSKTHPVIREYADILDRTPSALNMKVGNLGRLDPDLRGKGITGLGHGSKLDEEIWNEFYGNPDGLAYESERLIAELRKKDIEVSADIDTYNLPQGKEREAVVRQRVNQSFFRSAVISAYNFRCCISGIGNPTLLEACHIVGWSQDAVNRTNPKNGLCLNPFFHKAYDRMFISITPDLNIVVSDELLQRTADGRFKDYLAAVNGMRMTEPEKFQPDKDLLGLHYERYKNR